jgi:hypothetical protein
LQNYLNTSHEVGHTYTKDGHDPNYYPNYFGDDLINIVNAEKKFSELQKKLDLAESSGLNNFYAKDGHDPISYPYYS